MTQDKKMWLTAARLEQLTSPWMEAYVELERDLHTVGTNYRSLCSELDNVKNAEMRWEYSPFYHGFYDYPRRENPFQLYFDVAQTIKDLREMAAKAQGHRVFIGVEVFQLINGPEPEAIRSHLEGTKQSNLNLQAEIEKRRNDLQEKKEKAKEEKELKIKVEEEVKKIKDDEVPSKGCVIGMIFIGALIVMLLAHLGGWK